jgi:MioC protein
MDALLGTLGARKIGDRLEVDASTQPLPDEEAVGWVKEWVKLV